jgi:hypothetical protein
MTQEVMLHEHRDPNGRLIIRVMQLPDGMTAVDLECDEAHFFAQQLLPKAATVVDRPGKPKSRWLYQAKVKF